MKALMIYVGLIVSSMFLLNGCGSGSAGMTGTLDVQASNVSSTDTTSKVAFTITYTHPTADSVGGIRYNYALYIDGVLQAGYPVEGQMNDNGTNTFTKILSYDIDKTPATQTVRLVVSTDNLTSSDSVSITAVDVLEILPTIQTFAVTDLVGSTKTFSISGGVPPYIVTFEQSTAGLVTSVTTASSVTLTRALTSAGTVTITVKDSSDPVTPTEVQAQAILTVIPATP
ncbi:MAG: hypothetical protein PHD01_11350 [Geobacteraceae bacterium]|nr:hypothetical protein [Geobacteraceae bacterium]